MTTQTAPLKTLFDCFTHGGRQSEKRHRYIEPGGEIICRCRTYSEVLEDGRRAAGHFARHGLRKGDRLALMATNAKAFISAFLGGVHGGITLVPLCPPSLNGRVSSYTDHTNRILQAAGALAIVAPAAMRSVVEEVYEGIDFIAYEELQEDIETRPDPVELSLDDTVFIQFSSGSTGDPKGVIVSHGNIAANARAIMVHGLGITDSDVGVSWLPLFHDMGLIGNVLAPLIYPTEMVYLPTYAFIRNPNLWFETVSQYRGTITFGPNFAFALAVKHFRRRSLDLNLDSLRVLGCGAKPINVTVLQDLVRAFEPYGLRREAIMPCYGLAEATLAVSFDSITAPYHEIAIDQQSYESNREVRLAEEADGATSQVVRLVSCGKGFPEHEIAICGENGEVLPEGRVGEICVRGPSITAGYFRDPEAMERAYVDGWLKTGDLGFLLHGELYISGRVKDLIIVNGRNYYPQDIEWAVEQLPGVRSGAVAAFAVSGYDTECIVIVAEVKVKKRDEGLEERIGAVVSETFGLMVHDVVLVPSGSVPKSTSGKVQRCKTRSYYVDGCYRKLRFDLERDAVAA